MSTHVAISVVLYSLKFVDELSDLAGYWITVECLGEWCEKSLQWKAILVNFNLKKSNYESIA